MIRTPKPPISLVFVAEIRDCPNGDLPILSLSMGMSPFFGHTEK